MGTNEIFAFLKIGALPLTLGLVVAVFLFCMFGLGVLSWFCFNNTCLKVPFGICGGCLIAIFFVLAVVFFTLGMAIRTAIDQACSETNGSPVSEILAQVYDTADQYYGTSQCPLKVDSWTPPAGLSIDAAGGACGVQWCPDDVAKLVADALPDIPAIPG